MSLEYFSITTTDGAQTNVIVATVEIIVAIIFY